MSTAPSQPTPATIPPTSGGLNDQDAQVRARELQQERERMAIQYGFKWKEILWDKGFFAAILAAAAALGYFVANKYLDDRRAENTKTVEKFRAKEARELEEFRTAEALRRSIRDHRLEELFKINSAFSEVTRVYFPYARGKKPDKQQVKKEYESALEKAREVINRSPFLFDMAFNMDVDRYFEIHRKMSQLPIEKWAKYTKFAENLSNKFDDACRSVMADNRSDPKTRQRMGLDTEDVDSAKADDPEEYIETYYKVWEGWEDWKEKQRERK